MPASIPKNGTGRSIIRWLKQESFGLWRPSGRWRLRFGITTAGLAEGRYFCACARTARRPRTPGNCSLTLKLYCFPLPVAPFDNSKGQPRPELRMYSPRQEIHLSWTGDLPVNRLILAIQCPVLGGGSSFCWYREIPIRAGRRSPISDRLSPNVK